MGFLRNLLGLAAVAPVLVVGAPGHAVNDGAVVPPPSLDHQSSVVRVVTGEASWYGPGFYLSLIHISEPTRPY